MVTEARKRANAKWDKENMVVLACKVKRGDGGAVQGRLCCTGDNVQCGFAAGRENLFRRTPRAGTAPRRPECPGR